MPRASAHVHQDRLIGGAAGRLALVTGGGSGIGAACARALAADGFDVAVADLDLPAAGQVAAQCGARARAFAVDVSDESSVTALFTDLAAMPGVLAAAVNSAAVPDTGGPLADCDFSTWRRVLAVDLDGVFLCVRAELRAMLAAGGGSIVSIGSVLGLRGHPGVPTYSSAKHAIIGLHRSVALAYSGQGVRANVVCPGYIDTPMLSARLDDTRRTALVAQHPIGRLGTVGEVAAAVAWLAGPASSFVTGAVHTVDGGFTA